MEHSTGQSKSAEEGRRRKKENSRGYYTHFLPFLIFLTFLTRFASYLGMGHFTMRFKPTPHLGGQAGSYRHIALNLPSCACGLWTFWWLPATAIQTGSFKAGVDWLLLWRGLPDLLSTFPISSSPPLLLSSSIYRPPACQPVAGQTLRPGKGGTAGQAGRRFPFGQLPVRRTGRQTALQLYLPPPPLTDRQTCYSICPLPLHLAFTGRTSPDSSGGSLGLFCCFPSWTAADRPSPFVSLLPSSFLPH